MKTLRTIILIVGVAIIFSSCGRCGGCDEIDTVVGAQLIKNDSVNTTEISTVGMQITRKIVQKEGSRNCHYKDLVTCTEDNLPFDSMTLKCNKDLKLNIGSILANENLLTIKPLIDSSYTSAYNMATIKLSLANSFEKGIYSFILEGVTQNGKIYSDTSNIVFY